MKDIWYTDKRDLVKWSVLLKLAEINQMDKILQIAYYRESRFEEIQIGGMNHMIPDAVLHHFRRIQNIRKLKSTVRVSVFDESFGNRDEYHNNVIIYLAKYKNFKCIVFLDPDTGLQPPKGRAGLQHVSDSEIQKVWRSMKKDDVLVFYQHQTNRNGQPWIEPKRKQLANAIGVNEGSVKIASSVKIAHDVAFYYLSK